MTTTDPRAWLTEVQETVDIERVLRDGDPFYEVQGYLPDGTPLMECNRWERVGLDASAAMAAALTAVLDLHKPERRYLPYEGADVSYDTEREALEAGADADLNSVVIEDLMENGAPYFDLCAHCKVIEDSPCEGECTREAGYRESLHPCPTVTRITNALGGDRG